MADEDGATSKRSKLRVINEFNFFDENRDGPHRTISLPSQDSSSHSAANQRVIHEFDFFQENRTGPRCSHVVPIQEIKDDDADLPPPFLRSIVERIDDPQVALLFEKKLGVTDVQEFLSILHVAEGDRVMEALTEEERRKMEREGFLEVPTIDSRGNHYLMKLQFVAVFHAVVIFDKWHLVVSNNDLKEGERVQGWGFRNLQGEFHLAIN